VIKHCFLDDWLSRFKFTIVKILHSIQRPHIILLMQLYRVLKKCFEVPLLDLLLLIDDPLRLVDLLIQRLVVYLPLQLAHLVRNLFEVPLGLPVHLHCLL